jgi:hypothetical protein
MRQRALVILDPSEIAGVKPSAALVATEIVFGLTQWPPGDLLTDNGPAWKWIFHAPNFHLMFPFKKNRTPDRSEARLLWRAVYIRPCCHLDLYCHDERRCQTTGEQRAGSFCALARCGEEAQIGLVTRADSRLAEENTS